MARVSSILIYPEKDAPGQTLDASFVSPQGLDGDRRKKSPVHLVAVEDYVDQYPRANLIVTIPAVDLHTLVGHRVRIGKAELEVTAPAGDCPGVYASVPVPGDVAIGDELLVGDATSNA